MAKNTTKSFRVAALALAVMLVSFASACVEAPPDKIK